MKKPFKHIVLGNLVIVFLGLLYIYISDAGHHDQFILSAGMLLLLLTVVNIGIGVFLLLIGIGDKRFVNYGVSMLLFSAISLLCSFTCCSMQPLNL